MQSRLVPRHWPQEPQGQVRVHQWRRTRLRRRHWRSRLLHGRAIPIHTASVCRQIPKNTILLGNIFMQETGSAVDWGKREIIIRSTSGMADLVIPFAPPNEASEVTWCRGLQMTTEIEDEPYPYTESAGDSTPTSMVSNVKVLRATFAQFWNTWHSGTPTLPC